MSADNIWDALDALSEAYASTDNHPSESPARDELAAILRAARVLTHPMDYTTDEYVKASALLKALAEEAT